MERYPGQIVKAIGKCGKKQNPKWLQPEVQFWVIFKLFYQFPKFSTMYNFYFNFSKNVLKK